MQYFRTFIVSFCLYLSLFAFVVEGNQKPHRHDPKCQIAMEGGTYVVGAEDYPELKTLVDGSKYFVFRDLQHVNSVMKQAHRGSKDQLMDRYHLMKPILLGVAQFLKTPGLRGELSRSDKMELTGWIAAWFNTLQEMNARGLPIKSEMLSNFYSIASQLTSSFIFNDLRLAVISAAFAEIYAALRMSPPPKLGEKFINAYPKMISENSYSSQMRNLPQLLPYLATTAKQRASMANSWIKKMMELERSGDILDLREMGYVLSDLYEAHPPAALKYFKRNRNRFLTLDLDKPEYIIRPLMYFKYVMKEKNIPEFDRDRLKGIFASDKGNTSSLERKVQGWLDAYGVSYWAGKFDPEASAIEMDLLVRTENNQLINIEVDGPHHDITDLYGSSFRRLADVRRDEILQAMELELGMKIKVYRISYRDIEANSEKAEEDLIEFIMRH